MSEWITDRVPTADDEYGGYVWVTTEHGVVLRQMWDCTRGRPWQPIVPPEPYVKPKRYKVDELSYSRCRWLVRESQSGEARCHAVPTREAAERIAAIYEEVMP